MVDYLEILRLNSDPKNSQRCIASIVHCSRHTIRAVLEATKKAGLSWPLDDAVTNEMLKRMELMTLRIITVLPRRLLKA